MRTALLLLLLVAGPAHATILVHDSRFGPGTLIEDTVAGLEILKVTATTNIGIDAMTAALEPGGAYGEFRYGTLAEFDAFAENLEPIAAHHLMALLGPTLVSHSGIQALFMQFGPGDRPRDMIPILDLIVFIDGSFDVEISETNFQLANRPNAATGYFLVADPLAVPLPPTALLLVVGLVVVATFHRAWRA